LLTNVSGELPQLLIGLSLMSNQTVEELYAQIGRKILALRKAKSMSQEKLADASALDRTHIGFIEQGRRRPTIKTLYKLSEALDCEVEDFFKTD
jgi:DNA-binding XRE family transcriptional regulator